MEIRSNFDPARRPYPQADITRPNRETIDRETPEPVNPSDVRARLARERREALQLAKRIKNARQQVKAQDGDNPQRADKARAETSKAHRISQAREGLAEEAPRVDSAEVASAPVDLSERIKNARQKHLAVQGRQRLEAVALHERAMNARDKLSLSDTTLRLQADAASTSEDGSSRIADLRRRVENASLTTDELLSKAAFKLLSGD